MRYADVSPHHFKRSLSAISQKTPQSLNTRRCVDAAVAVGVLVVGVHVGMLHAAVLVDVIVDIDRLSLL